MKITRTEKTISVTTPYNPDLPHLARDLGGSWNPSKKCWRFDIRDEERVKELYMQIYGEWDSDDETPADAVTVRVTTDDISTLHGGIFFAGRQVARATGRDSGATLGKGVILLDGQFTSCGSMKNWRTGADYETIFELRDVPLTMVNKESDNSDWKKIEVLGDVNHAALSEERERLLKRIVEIEAILGKSNEKF